MTSNTKEIISKIKESFDTEIDESLVELKKEMAWRIVDKMQEKKWDIRLWVWKSLVVDYLVNEWNLDSISDELILWKMLELDIFKDSTLELKNLREEIWSITTESDLQSLEIKIINQLNWNSQDNSDFSSTTTPSSSWFEWTSSWETTIENNSSGWESLDDSAPVGEAKEVELKRRMNWLFPEWVPQTEKEMKKYITKIKVPILTENGKIKKLKLYVHKKLANEYIAVFEEMKRTWIKINPDTTSCFNRRRMRKWKKMSHHSYGTAIDVNRDVNGWVYWKTDNSSPYFNNQATVDIRKKHGFYWGWDRSSKNNDPMHFTYMNA